MAWLGPQMMASTAGAVQKVSVGKARSSKAMGARLETSYGQEIGALSSSGRSWGANALLIGFTALAALASYMVSMRVSNERATVDALTHENLAISQELKGMADELRVRMRLPQLQLWNDSVFGMVPISADQFLANSADLAAYGTPPAAEPAPPALRYAITEPRQAPAAPRLATARPPVAQPARPKEAPLVHLASAKLPDKHPAEAHKRVSEAPAETPAKRARRHADKTIWKDLPAFEEVPHIARATRPAERPESGPTDLLQQIAMNSQPASPAPFK